MTAPETWARARLGDACELVNGRAYKQPELLGKGKYQVIRVGNFFSSQKWYYSDFELEDSKYCNSGDLLYAWSASFGPKIWTGEKAIFHYHIWRVQIEQSVVDKMFLYHWFQWDKNNIKAEHGTGSTMIHVTKGDMEARSIALPPLAEQRRIVAKLDALTARTARARADLDRIPALAARYKQAVLAKAFSGELTTGYDAAEFSLASLSDVLESTFYGPRFNKEAYCEAGVPTLRTTDFDDSGRVRLKGPPQVSVSAKELEKWGLRDGDLLVTRTGSIGKCAVYETSMGPALPSAYLIRTRLNLSSIVPRFALLFLLSPSGQEQLGLGITAVTQPNINAGVIERLRLPVPSLETQAEVVAKIDAMFAEIDRLIMETVAARRLLDRLDQAVLAKAFRGELVPQDTADEPASALLDRIRAERASAPKAPRGRRKAVA